FSDISTLKSTLMKVGFEGMTTIKKLTTLKMAKYLTPELSKDNGFDSELVFENSVNAAISIPANDRGPLIEKSESLPTSPSKQDIVPKQVRINPDNLKDLIVDQQNKTKIRPILIAFSGLPQSDLDTMTPKHEKDNKAAGISYFELVACGFHCLRHPVITEVTKNSSCAFSFLSAFSKLIERGNIPNFDVESDSASSFGDKEFDQILQRFLYYLKDKYKPRAEEKKYAKHFKETLPEGIALINIWDLAINKAVFHFLSGLIGHLYNSHMWLFLNINRDLDELHQPLPPFERQLSEPQNEENIQDLMKWRP
uniref:Uncharacterized protein n=1 Tax=Amphimedon queenslandica TaxID=400682 RepID=A0A1X7VPK5_AMPQE